MRSTLVSLTAVVRRSAGTEGALVSGLVELVLETELAIELATELDCELDCELMVPVLLRELEERRLLDTRDELLDLTLLLDELLLEAELGGLSSQSLPGGAVLTLRLVLREDQLPLASPACTR